MSNASMQGPVPDDHPNSIVGQLRILGMLLEENGFDGHWPDLVRQAADQLAAPSSTDRETLAKALDELEALFRVMDDVDGDDREGHDSELVLLVDARAALERLAVIAAGYRKDLEQ
jgi:hypothetical protein